VNSTLLSKRLLAGQNAFNVRGVDAFEFTMTNGMVGSYLLAFNWLNPYADATTGAARQLVIYGYSLRCLATEVFQVTLAASGSVPVVTQLDVGTYAGTVPGGWLCAINSYGRLVEARHESQVFSGNDTIVSAHPLSNQLTGLTGEKCEDIIQAGTDILLPDDSGLLPMGPLGSIIIT